MQRLTALLQRFAKPRRGPTARYWIGATPQVHRKLIPYVIAAELGYETPETSRRAQDELMKPRGALKLIDRKAAALTLAFAAADPIAYSGRTPPRAGIAELASEAFQDLQPDAEFYSNGDWPNYWRSSAFGFSGISDATFDAGVIGFDNETAFIFWMEDED